MQSSFSFWFLAFCIRVPGWPITAIKNFFYFLFYVTECFGSLYVYALYMCLVPTDSRADIDPLELELQTSVNHHVGGTKPELPARATTALNSWGNSSAPVHWLLRFCFCILNFEPFVCLPCCHATQHLPFCSLFSSRNRGMEKLRNLSE